MAATGCATILYPERRGNRGGRIDPGPLILDILWFIPGIIPGVIALAVDFGTGAIYVSDGQWVKDREGDTPTPLGVRRGEVISVTSPVVSPATHVELRIVTDEGDVVTAAGGRWGADPGEVLRVEVPRRPAMRERQGALELWIARTNRTARYPLLLGHTPSLRDARARTIEF